jgi:hypothetical protein
MANARNYDGQTHANKAVVDIGAFLDNIPCEVRHADGRRETVSLFAVINTEFQWGAPAPTISEIEQLFNAAVERPELKAVFLGWVALRTAMAAVYEEEHDKREAPHAGRVLTPEQKDELKREAYMREERGMPKKVIVAELIEKFEATPTMLKKVLPKLPRGRPKGARKPATKRK